jgi:hypothetical protein
MKSPRQVRSDIRTLTMHIGQVRDALHRKVEVNRRVRETDIDVFCSPDHALAVRMAGSST